MRAETMAGRDAIAQYSIAYGDERIGFSLRWRARAPQRVAIHVTPDGAVQVDAPPGTPLPAVKQALRVRAGWVWQQLQAQRERQRHVLPRQYLSGEAHFYLGRRHLLKLLPAPAGQADVRLWRGRLEVSSAALDPASVRRLLQAWYRERALVVFARVVADMASRVPGLRRATVPLGLLSMKTQWGSCSPQGELLLNPELVKAPRSCIEYVVAHELCHLREHNHSERFYRLLGTALPDWELRKRELDDLAELVLNR